MNAGMYNMDCLASLKQTHMSVTLKSGTYKTVGNITTTVTNCDEQDLDEVEIDGCDDLKCPSVNCQCVYF
jgi:hypothetical protein